VPKADRLPSYGGYAIPKAGRLLFDVFLSKT